MVKEELSIDETEEIKKKVEDNTLRTFYIKDCPESLWREFNEIAKKEHKNDYSLTLGNLVNLKKIDAKSIAIVNMVNDLDEKIKRHDEIILKLLNRLNEVEKNE